MVQRVSSSPPPSSGSDATSNNNGKIVAATVLGSMSMLQNALCGLEPGLEFTTALSATGRHQRIVLAGTSCCCASYRSDLPPYFVATQRRHPLTILFAYY